MLGINDVEGNIADANMKYDETKGVMLIDDISLVREINKEQETHPILMAFQFLGMLIVRASKFMYDVFYYYFAPFLVVGLIFFFG